MRLMKSLYIATLIAVVTVSSSVAMAGSQRQAASLQQLQALYVQRLVKYIQWPQGMGPKPGQPFIVAATDSRSLKPYFTTGNDSARFKLVQWPAKEYHILIVNGAPEREAAAILKRTAGQGVLTIGQNPANLRQGVVINFYLLNGRLKMQVNPRAANRAGLSISSKLMKLVKVYAGDDDE